MDQVVTHFIETIQMKHDEITNKLWDMNSSELALSIDYPHGDLNKVIPFLDLELDIDEPGYLYITRYTIKKKILIDAVDKTYDLLDFCRTEGNLENLT